MKQLGEQGAWFYANTVDKRKECMDQSKCFDCGQKGHRVGDVSCPRKAERDKANAEGGIGRGKRAAIPDANLTNKDVAKSLKSFQSSMDKSAQKVNERLNKMESSFNARNNAEAGPSESASAAQVPKFDQYTGARL